MSNLTKIWEELESDPRPWGVKLLDTGKHLQQFCGLSNNLAPIFMVKSPSDPGQYSQLESVLVTTTQGKDGKWVQIFELKNRHQINEFSILCEDMRYSIQNAADVSEALKRQSEVYEDWVEFYKRTKGFSKDAARGLFGELTFLLDELLSTMTGTEALECWQGPLGCPQDFILPNFSAVEVKTIQATSSKIKISSETQLDFDGPLKLVVYRMISRSSLTGGKTLKELVETCLERLPPHDGQKFNALLRSTGYNSDTPEATSILFDVEKPIIFDVQMIGFPRITQRSINHAVSAVSYSISIQSLDPFKM